MTTSSFATSGLRLGHQYQAPAPTGEQRFRLPVAGCVVENQQRLIAASWMATVAGSHLIRHLPNRACVTSALFWRFASQESSRQNQSIRVELGV
jgi:hypothetical protein